MNGVAATRESSSAQPTSPREAISASTKYMPKPRPATSASRMLWRCRRGSAPRRRRSSREASTTPTTAATRPTERSSPGSSPVARPTSTGSATPVEATGATMLIVPIASAR